VNLNLSCDVFQIASTFLTYPGEKADGEDITSETVEATRCLMCVARRIAPNEETSGLASEQFVTKLDTTGKIIGIDTSGVSSTYSQYLNRVNFVILTVVLSFKCCGRGDRYVVEKMQENFMFM
jgi:hypothetical protein